MNTQRLRSLFSRQNAAPFTFFFLLIVVFVFGLMHSSATAGGGRGQRPQFPSDEELKKDFDDDDLKTKDDKPGGRWTYGTLLDSNQMNDPSVPAYVRSVQIVSGGGKYQGIHKIKRVEVTNKTSLTIVSMQMRVEVVRFNEPEKILLEDELPFVNVTIDPNASQVVDITTIRPPRLLKALAKDGELSGDFRIRISMQAVRFADGSFWRRRPTPAALLSSPYLDQSLGLKFPDIASLAEHIPPPFRSSDTKRPDTTRCTGEPRLAASAFSSVRFEFDTCSDNSDARIDSTGRKDCGNPGIGACYAHCSDDGWCATWESPTPCSGPTATPPTGTCPWPPPAPCCEPEETIPNNCTWNCRSPNCGTGTVFADGCVSVSGPVVCDEGFVFTSGGAYGAACCPTPPPTPTPPGGGGGDLYGEGHGGTSWCGIDVPATCSDFIDNDGDGPRDEQDEDCICPSPIVIDTLGDGFDLTDAAGGVWFDIAGTGRPIRLSWIEGDDAWLALDRDGNGLIESGAELFGNYTAQPAPPAGEQKHGFRALAEFDKAEKGGNGDGVIDKRDAIFASLRLWQDTNHNGVSEPEELHAIRELGLKSVNLDYKESKRVDRHGNKFRYRAKVRDTRGAQLGRWAWDVFLVKGQ